MIVSRPRNGGAGRPQGHAQGPVIWRRPYYCLPAAMIMMASAQARKRPRLCRHRSLPSEFRRHRASQPVMPADAAIRDRYLSKRRRPVSRRRADAQASMPPGARRYCHRSCAGHLKSRYRMSPIAAIYRRPPCLAPRWQAIILLLYCLIISYSVVDIADDEIYRGR